MNGIRIILAAFLMALRDGDAGIRIQAIRALDLDRDRNDKIYNAVVEGLHDPGTNAEVSIFMGKRKDLRALPHLLKTLQGNEPGTAKRAQLALIGFGKPAVEGLIAILQDRNKEFPMREIVRQRERRKNPLAFMRCGLDGPQPDLDPRVLAAGALGAIGDQRALKPLTLAQRNRASWLRLASSAALAELRKKNASKGTSE